MKPRLITVTFTEAAEVDSMAGETAEEDISLLLDSVRKQVQFFLQYLIYLFKTLGWVLEMTFGWKRQNGSGEIFFKFFIFKLHLE